jgi:hypothetical protein
LELLGTRPCEETLFLSKIIISGFNFLNDFDKTGYFFNFLNYFEKTGYFFNFLNDFKKQGISLSPSLHSNKRYYF